MRGYSVLEWHLRAGRRNEALDCLAGVLGVMVWLNPALDVLSHRNSKVTDAPVPAAQTVRARAEAPADPELERLAARQAQGGEAPSAPAQIGPHIVRRHSGAWFESGGGGRRRRG